ncbi:MAG: hypothetical protein AAGN35_23585 [Bacteroidota bacterium]
MPREYNYIYNKLVDGEGDIAGHIAYSLYKQHKAEFIAKFKKDNPNRVDLSEADFKSFNNFSRTQQQIDNDKVRAELILQEFLTVALNETVEEIAEQTKANFESHLENTLKKLHPTTFWQSFGRGLASSLAGAFIFALIVAAFLFINRENPPIYLNKSPSIENQASVESKNPIPADVEDTSRNSSGSLGSE